MHIINALDLSYFDTSQVIIVKPEIMPHSIRAHKKYLEALIFFIYNNFVKKLLLNFQIHILFYV